MIRHEHYGSGWKARLASLYAALQADDHVPPSSALPELCTGPLDRAVAALQDRLNIGLSPVIDAYLSALPYPRRATVLLKLLSRGFDASLSLTLPPCIESRYHGQLAGMGHILRRLARLSPHP
jgi:hypothetical protein